MALAGDGRSHLDKFRAHVLARGGETPQRVLSRLEPFCSRLLPNVCNTRLPDASKTPSAVMGRRMVMAGSSGGGDAWKPGDGAAAMRTLLAGHADASAFPAQVLKRLSRGLDAAG